MTREAGVRIRNLAAQAMESKVYFVMIKAIVLIVLFALALNLTPAFASPLDNSSLIPKIQSDNRVRMEGMSPDWVKTLILAELRIETATPEGTFASATTMLDHYARMGVNGLWICPIWERGAVGYGFNGYGNVGLDRVDPKLTGSADTDFSAVRDFVKEAHKRNIRVLFDAIVWGTAKTSTLVTQHPEYYVTRPDGSFWQVWGGYGFNWNNHGLRLWYTNAAVNFIDQTGADGFRVDLAPDTSGYFYKGIRDALYAQGKKIAIMAEIQNLRKDTFDLDECSVHPYPYFFDNNIVDSIKSGTGIGKREGLGEFRFYTSDLVNHDDHKPAALGNRVRFAYGSILAPFIPMWWIGEEWNNPQSVRNVLYFNKIDWSTISGDNLAYYEDVKRYIAIRRSFPAIFENFPASTRDANIAKVTSTLAGAPNALQAYARYAGGVSILVVPNYQSLAPSASANISLDYSAWGLDISKRFKVIDLMTDKIIARGLDSTHNAFTTDIGNDRLGVYLVEHEK